MQFVRQIWQLLMSMFSSSAAQLRSAVSESTPLFGKFGDDDDPLKAGFIDSLSSQGIQPEEIGARFDAMFPGAITEAGARLLDGLKANAREMFADRRKIRKGFQRRQREKWGKPLDLLLMLMEAAREAGEEYNASFQATPPPHDDFVFDVLRRLHARGCLIASEILWLMEGGYASGAMARWRALHEIAVVTSFVRDKGQDVAERYILHHFAESCRAAAQYQEHCRMLGHEPIPEDKLRQLVAHRDALCARFGNPFKKDWGWAADALKTENPNFAEIEKAVSLEHYRPYFKLASHSTHAGSKGTWFDLGNALVPPDRQVLLAGPSDAGLTDPGVCTAVSLLQITTTLLFHPNTKLTALVFAECLTELTSEIREAFATAEHELALQAEAINREQTTQHRLRLLAGES